MARPIAAKDGSEVMSGEGEEFLCARCARYMRTCCQTSEVYATPADVRRIEAHIGRSDFYEYRVPSDPIYLQHDDDPNWPLYVIQPDGTRRVLRRQKDGGCTFLGERGCVLPLDIRPLICRIYPYDFNESGIKEALCTGCPSELLRPGQTLVQALVMNRDEAEAWRKQLYKDIREESELHSQHLPAAQ
jgi:Fe-S-cluster containining protein